MSRPLLSTHALDTSSGSPAAGLFVELYKKREDTWTLWHSTVTCGDGRVHFPFSQDSMAAGTYKLKFNVEEYYKKTARSTLYPFIEVVFNTAEGAHYHIPLLLSPYGYTTYRGT